MAEGGKGVVSRVDVIQAFLSLYDRPEYLEVGVCTGATFHALAADRKVAVDPAFRFDPGAAAADHPNCTYHAVESDTWFGTIAGRDERFDVIFLDGLHTFEQTLRDLINALTLIRPGGVIVIDDIMPSSYAASLPDLARFNRFREVAGVKRGTWMGDVYKLVFFIETFVQGYTFRCVAENHGQLVMWRAPRPSVPARTIAALAAIGYEDAVLERARFRFTPLAAIVAEVRAALGR